MLLVRPVVPGDSVLLFLFDSHNWKRKVCQHLKVKITLFCRSLSDSPTMPRYITERFFLNSNTSIIFQLQWIYTCYKTRLQLEMPIFTGSSSGCFLHYNCILFHRIVWWMYQTKLTTFQNYTPKFTTTCVMKWVMNDISPWARPPNFGYRYHLGWIIRMVIFG